MTSGFRPSCRSLVTILQGTRPTETAGLQAGAQTLRLVYCPLLGGSSQCWVAAALQATAPVHVQRLS